MKRKQEYLPEFREEAVKLVMEQGLSLGEAAKRLTIPKRTLGNWVVLSKGAPPKVPLCNRGVMELEQENSRLREELAETTLERDILTDVTHLSPEVGTTRELPQSLFKVF